MKKTRQQYIPPEIPALTNDFTGRIWLLPKLVEWIKNPTKPYFLITGKPRAGKTTLLAWLAGYGPLPQKKEARAQLNALRRKVGAIHFCTAGSLSTDPVELAQKMARQLSQKIPEFTQAVVDSLGSLVTISSDVQIGRAKKSNIHGIYIENFNVGDLADETAFNRAFLRPLSQLYENGYSKTILLLVDALDEAETYGGTKISTLLAGLASLKGKVLVLATTRPDSRVTRHFEITHSI